MKDLLENLKRRLAEEETARYLRFMAIPLIAVVLVIIIIVADKPQEDGGMEETAVLQSETGRAGESEEETETAAETVYRLEEAGEEIVNLMEAYFKARRTCDVNGLAEVYGDSASPEELREESLRMEEEVKYYQSYRDLSCYSVTGPAEDSLVVYTRFYIKFRQSDTMAPSMFACFVKRGADGSYHMTAEISPEESAYMAEVNESEAVQAMAGEVNESLRAALESDSNLLFVYNTLMSGEEAPDSGEDADSVDGETGEGADSRN